MANFVAASPHGAVSPEQTRLLLKSIRRIVRANDLQSRALARSIGLTGPQLVILMAVTELGEVTTKALADHADLSPATVVTVLENLEQRGIVQRYRSGTDRRVVFTRLTPKGQELISHAPSVFGAQFARRFAELPPERRNVLVESLAELANLMTARPEPESPS
ncbi:MULTISPECIES: MarR family winged helix-turn-helix transcriptional regulator [Chelativorans]|jgi:DNA-binding MarR family transcriptional regulator|uniref:Transcriptional regulator, TrmB n=1 Tax=Chelativorans sp. (strain BNC1) TaxID=266779 RepID=Q11FH1_CHESB|nr:MULTISPECIES: MarR family transcriptional regulator [Chelativorans]